MASRTSRKEWVRGLPSAFGVGKYDRKRVHSASERTVGYGFLMRESVQHHTNPLLYQTGSYEAAATGVKGFNNLDLEGLRARLARLFAAEDLHDAPRPQGVGSLRALEVPGLPDGGPHAPAGEQPPDLLLTETFSTADRLTLDPLQRHRLGAPARLIARRLHDVSRAPEVRTIPYCKVHPLTSRSYPYAGLRRVWR
jgi:hypothetical protein